MNRGSLNRLLENLLQRWNGVDDGGHIFAEGVRLYSSHVGNAIGGEALIAQLQRGSTESLKMRVEHSNAIFRAAGSDAVATAYVHGDLQESIGSQPVASFGGVLVLAIGDKGEGARIHEVRLQLRWVQGRGTALEGWNLPIMDRQWKPGDSVNSLTSEMDAAWHRIPNSDLALTDSEAIAEAWSRYAWALDQADFGLFDQAFTDDATAELTPMGQLNGKRVLLSTLKEFRMPWPWMMHYGAPIKIEIGANSEEATMVMGRIMPGQNRAPDGSRIYGAHYSIRLRKEAGSWRMSQMDYIPGWIRAG
jgi:hypothetical protein